MPILASDIKTQLAAELEAEGNDYYKWAEDYRPAIHYSIDLILHAVTDKLGSKKFTSEAVRELRKVWVFQANSFSRINIPDSVWTIEAVHPNPVTYPSNPTILPAQPHVSLLRNDVSAVSWVESADRGIAEEVKLWNPLKAGYPYETRDISLTSYMYFEMSDISSTAYPLSNPREIFISPSVASKLVALEIIKNPDKPVLETDNIEFPRTIFNFIVEAALIQLAYKPMDAESGYKVALTELYEKIKNF